MIAVLLMRVEPGLLRAMEKQHRLQLVLRDDPLVQPDEFRVLSASGHQDLSSRYALG